MTAKTREGLHRSAALLLVGSTEEGQVVLVDVLGDVKAVGLDQLLVLRQLVLLTTKTSPKPSPESGRKSLYGGPEQNSQC